MRATSRLLVAALVAIGVPASGKTIIVGPGDSIQADLTPFESAPAPALLAASREGTVAAAGDEPAVSWRG